MARSAQPGNRTSGKEYDSTYSLEDGETGPPGTGFGGLSGLGQFAGTSIGKAVLTVVGAIAGDPTLAGQVSGAAASAGKLGIGADPTGPTAGLFVLPGGRPGATPGGILREPPPVRPPATKRTFTRADAINEARVYVGRHFPRPQYSTAQRRAIFGQALRVTLSKVT